MNMPRRGGDCFGLVAIKKTGRSSCRLNYNIHGLSQSYFFFVTTRFGVLAVAGRAVLVVAGFLAAARIGLAPLAACFWLRPTGS